ncbi:MAG: type VI secretion system ImpA family N-terminal domain-containing protein [Pseudomonadota bacterium]
MSGLDLSQYCAPLSSGPPGGDDCEYDPRFQALEALFAARQLGMAAPDEADEDDRNWGDGREAALALFETTRDVRVACRLAACLLYTEGLAGFAEGLSVVEAHIGPLWEDAHPHLDADDKFDPTARCNAFALFGDGLVKRGFETASLAVGALRRPATLVDAQIASGRRAPPDADALTAARGLVDDAMANDREGAEASLAAVRRARGSVSRILSEWDARMRALDEQGAVETTQSPRLEDVDAALAAIERELADRLEGASAAEEASMETAGPAATNGAAAPAAAQPGAIRSREDAGRELARIAAWFRENEPSSPVPLMIDRARRMINRPFLDIISDLGSDGLEDLRRAIEAAD